jgi:hypothetical protein
MITSYRIIDCTLGVLMASSELMNGLNFRLTSEQNVSKLQPVKLNELIVQDPNLFFQFTLSEVIYKIGMVYYFHINPSLFDAHPELRKVNYSDALSSIKSVMHLLRFPTNFNNNYAFDYSFAVKQLNLYALEYNTANIDFANCVRDFASALKIFNTSRETYV